MSEGSEFLRSDEWELPVLDNATQAVLRDAALPTGVACTKENDAMLQLLQRRKLIQFDDGVGKATDLGLQVFVGLTRRFLVLGGEPGWFLGTHWAQRLGLLGQLNEWRKENQWWRCA
jgi:hypothetical protein